MTENWAYHEQLGGEELEEGHLGGGHGQSSLVGKMIHLSGLCQHQAVTTVYCSYQLQTSPAKN